MGFRLFWALFFSLFLSFASKAANPSFDVVFDLDWTLFYPVETRLDNDTVCSNNECFRLADRAAEVIARLYSEGHRISLFSGGSTDRNQMLEEFLTQKIRSTGLHDFAFFKMLNVQDLTPRQGVSPQARFSQRYFKDLRKINPDLSHVILIDDVEYFAAPGQEKNLFVLAHTYQFHEKFDPSARGPYDPPSEREWRMERYKIQNFYELFHQSLQAGGEDSLVRLQGLRNGALLCSKVF